MVSVTAMVSRESTLRGAFALRDETCDSRVDIFASSFPGTHPRIIQEDTGEVQKETGELPDKLPRI
jgi:hypothetical protein